MELDYETLKKETREYQELIISGETAEAQKLKPKLYYRLLGPRAVQYLTGLDRVLQAVKEGGKIRDIIPRLKRMRLLQDEAMALTHFEALLDEKEKTKFRKGR